MSSYENSSLTEIEAVLDGLEEATPTEVFDATRQYAPRALAAVAASRADAAGGGGGTVSVIGPFTVAHNTPALINDPGAPLVELTEGQWIIDGWVQVVTEFDVADPLFLQTDGNVSAFMWEGFDLSAGQDVFNQDLEYNQDLAGAPVNKFTLSRANDARTRCVPARVAADCTLNAVMYPSGPNPAAGEARLWLLVHTPA